MAQWSYLLKNNIWVAPDLHILSNFEKEQILGLVI